MQPTVSQPADTGTLVLASASPRRRELLGLLGVPFTVRPADIDETIGDEPVAAAVRRLACQKAAHVASVSGPTAVLAADTLVSLDDMALGKPATPELARDYLRALRGREHSVLTGVCLRVVGAELSRVIATRVLMRGYSDAEVEQTIARGTPFDKAGGYAIQDEAFNPVASIDGCYCNVVGLPLWTVYDLLEAAETGLPLSRPDLRSPVCVTCPLRI